MYAVISTGGKQYKVAEGETIDIEKLIGNVGDSVSFDTLALCDGSNMTFDSDKLEKASVFGEIVDQFKGDKALVFKFKKRKGYKKLRGHRQQLTKVLITGISATGEKPKAKKAAPKSEDKTVAAKAAESAATADIAKAEDSKVEAPVEAKKSEETSAKKTTTAKKATAAKKTTTKATTAKKTTTTKAATAKKTTAKKAATTKSTTAKKTTTAKKASTTKAATAEKKTTAAKKTAEKKDESAED